MTPTEFIDANRSTHKKFAVAVLARRSDDEPWQLAILGDDHHVDLILDSIGNDIDIAIGHLHRSDAGVLK